jgi:hypothetical protein
MKELLNVIEELKAPKNQRNTFGNYNYRSCEDILEAVKPLLKKYGLIMTLTDEIVEIGGRVYVKASALLTDGTGIQASTAYAREPEHKKGMDESQITGAASSYARKYALNGLFLIDDSKDADSQEPAQPKVTTKEPAQKNHEIDSIMAEAVSLLANQSEEIKAQFRAQYKGVKSVSDARAYLANVKKAVMVSEVFQDDELPPVEIF